VERIFCYYWQKTSDGRERHGFFSQKVKIDGLIFDVNLKNLPTTLPNKNASADNQALA